MENQPIGTTEANDNQAEVNPWIAAFAALEPKDEEDAQADTGDSGSGSGVGDTQADSGQQLSDQDEADDGNTSEDIAGGSSADAGESGTENSTAFESMLGITEESIKQYEQDLDATLRDRAISDVAEQFIKRGVRNTNGQLGATLDDKDICKRDEDGVPHFYNPETGREFTGDNPRREAKQWVDDYNEELARVFNNTCAQYEKHLKEQAAPQLAVMKFAPKYEALDDIRKGMFDNMIEGYEIKDDQGKVIGYSCDLDKALNVVERQISMIQDYAKKQSAQPAQKPASGPALDMKTSSGAVPSGEVKPPDSIAAAMEIIENRKLANLRK